MPFFFGFSVSRPARRVGRLGYRRRGLLDGHFGDRSRGLLDLGLHLGLLVGPRLDAVLLRGRLAGLRSPPWPSLLDGPEPLAICCTAAATALARRRQAFLAPAAPSRRVLVAEPRLLLRGDALVALGHDLALVDPDLHADAAVGRLGLDEAVVDVGADRVQRHTALGVALGAAHLRAAQASTALDLHAVRARADRGGERALHRAPEAHAVLELLGDRLSDELRVELGPLDLVDVDVDVLVGHAVDLFAERVHLGARLPDDDPRASRVDVDRDPLFVLADQDVGQARVGQLAVDVLADLHVLEDRGRELLVARVPVGLPVVDDADAHPAGMNFLAH